MTDKIDGLFHNKRVNWDKLERFGFRNTGAGWVYGRLLPESGFTLTVRVTPAGGLSAEVTDPALGEPYLLHLANSATGGFVGTVRSQYEAALAEIARACFEPDVFHSGQAGELIRRVRDVYGDGLEFLWEKFPQNAVWRRKDTKKWYGALLAVPCRKLGIPCDGAAEILDLRGKPEELEALLDGRRYLAGYHMNKKHWYAILLGGGVPLEEIFQRLDESYLLAAK